MTWKICLSFVFTLSDIFLNHCLTKIKKKSYIYLESISDQIRIPTYYYKKMNYTELKLKVSNNV